MTCAAQGTPICMTCTLTPTAKFEVTASADVTFSGAMKNGIPARSRSDCTCRASARLQTLQSSTSLRSSAYWSSSHRESALGESFSAESQAFGDSRLTKAVGALNGDRVG